MKSDRGAEPIVRLRDIEKSYAGTVALAGVSLDLVPGRVTALAGENGAGKSTLIKILSGAVALDSGAVDVAGRHVAATPGAIIEAGVSVIYQELTDVRDMSVTDNLFLGRMPAKMGLVSHSQAHAQAQKELARVGLAHLDVTKSIGTLTIAQRQLVEVARCLARNAKVLVFDEPTSSLSESEAETLLDVIRQLRTEGLAILYVSHHLEELFEIADDIVVLRDGTVVAQKPVTEWTKGGLVRAMLARDLKNAYPWKERAIGDTSVSVSNLRVAHIDEASVVGRKQEIVGLIGLAGAGRTELMRALAGIDQPLGGEVSVDQKPLALGSITEARKAGISYVPEDRKSAGLVLNTSVQDNIIQGNYSLVSTLGWFRKARVSRLVATLIRSFGVKTSNERDPISELSGGNQQKILLARATARDPKVILLDDPTRGVDVGSKAAIYEKVFEIASAGATVFVTSSDTDEVLAVTDRSYILRSGRVVAEVSRKDYDREEILHLASVG